MVCQTSNEAPTAWLWALRAAWGPWSIDHKATLTPCTDWGIDGSQGREGGSVHRWRQYVHAFQPFPLLAHRAIYFIHWRKIDVSVCIWALSAWFYRSPPFYDIFKLRLSCNLRLALNTAPSCWCQAIVTSFIKEVLTQPSPGTAINSKRSPEMGWGLLSYLLSSWSGTWVRVDPCFLKEKFFHLFICFFFLSPPLTNPLFFSLIHTQTCIYASFYSVSKGSHLSSNRIM